MSEEDLQYEGIPAVALARILELQPDFLAGKPADLVIQELRDDENFAVNATDYLSEQFSAAVGCIAIHAMGNPEIYDIEEEKAYEPGLDKVKIQRRSFSEAGLQAFRRDVISAAQHLCSGATNYFNLMRQAEAGLDERGDTVDGSYELLEQKLIDHALEETNGTVACFDFTPRTS